MVEWKTWRLNEGSDSPNCVTVYLHGEFIVAPKGRFPWTWIA